ncbi:alpha/beta fold hydrolase [soil metagenome]
MKLNLALHGQPGEAPPLVIAHGLFGSARNWGAVAKRLCAGRLVVAADLRNHGESGWDDEHGYAAMAGDIAEVIAGHGGRADVLGHSMGGKTAMVLALSEPARVRRLVVADIAPIAYGHSQMPLVKAMREADLAGVTRRSQADARLAERVPERGERAFLLQSLALGEDGARWKLNLAALGANMEAIMGFPPLEGRFEGPVLVLRGAASDYVDAAGVAAIRARFPQARIEALAGAGHWLHADQPEAFADAVDGFLRAG